MLKDLSLIFRWTVRIWEKVKGGITCEMAKFKIGLWVNTERKYYLIAKSFKKTCSMFRTPAHMKYSRRRMYLLYLPEQQLMQLHPQLQHSQQLHLMQHNS